MYGKYKIAALCLSGIRQEDTQTILYSLSRQLAKHNWKLFVYSCGTDLYVKTPFDRGEAAVFNIIDYKFVDAVIVFNESIKDKNIVRTIIDEAQSHGKPAIVINDGTIESNAIDVFYKEGDAFRELVEHLVVDHGYKHFGCIAGIEGNEVSERREAVFREVLREHNIEFDEKYFGYGGFYDFPTVNLMNKFFSYGEKLPEVIVCVNDTMAIVAAVELQKRGIKVPEEVAVTGFDGILQGKNYFPQISTCDIVPDDVAKEITDILVESEKTELVKDKRYVNYHFCKRASCGCSKNEELEFSKIINSLYDKTYVNTWYENSMTNMLSNIVDLDSSEGMDSLLKYYINGSTVNLDTYICMNYNEEGARDTLHLYNHNPYTRKLVAKRYFDKEDVTSSYIDREDFIPNLSAMLERAGTQVIFSIHSQENVIGYMTSFLSHESFEEFSRFVVKLQRLVTNIDTCFSMYLQQLSLKMKNKELMEIQDKIIAGFADLVESRDDSTGQHVKRTAAYMDMLLQRLSKKPKYKDILTKEQCTLIHKAAPLHDIGKIKISDTILNKPGRLTTDEFSVIKTHTLEGSGIINSILVGLEDRSYLKIANDVALYHHEKWDGSGYPYGLEGERIPIAARLMAVVDVFDALCSKRVYKDAFSMDEAFRIIEESRGSHFDPDIVDAFMELREQIEILDYELNK